MGFGSIRLFEVMEMGVAPVLMADRYALPPGPHWNSFLLQVPERDFRRLPELLEAHIAESRERGQRAREAWEQYFAPELVFDRMIDQLIEIRRDRLIPERLYRSMWPVIQLRASTRRGISNVLRMGVKMTRQVLGRKSKDENSASRNPA
jgi:hypothetical protein